MSVPADFVASEYDSNPTRADSQFNDRWWRINGIRVDRIRRQSALMAPTDEGVGLHVTFDSERDVAKLNKGQVIDVRCEGDGMGDDYAKFENCKLLRRRRGD